MIHEGTWVLAKVAVKRVTGMYHVELPTTMQHRAAGNILKPVVHIATKKLIGLLNNQIMQK